MYEKVRREKPGRRRPLLTALVVLAVLIIAIVVVTAVWFSGYQGRYYDFISALSESTHYAYENGSVRAEYMGGRCLVRPVNVYNIFTYLSVYGPGRECRAPERDEAGLQIDYGDDCSMYLWDAGDGRMGVSFSGDGGYSYAYTTSDIDFETVLVRYVEGRQ